MEKKVYKVVHMDGEGEYSSIFAGQECDTGIGMSRHPKLEYRIGVVTVAPGGSLGVHCYGDFEKAKRHAGGNTAYAIQKPGAVLEVEPIKVMGRPENWGDNVLLPAVRPIKEVWRAEPEKPKEEWKDVTSECEYKISYSSPHWVSIIHENSERFLLGSNGVMDWKPGLMGLGYQIETFPKGGNSYECGGFKVWLKVTS